MRACWLKDLAINSDYKISEESAHHLINVLRVKTKENLLLMDGKGFFVETEIERISKKEIFLTHKNSYYKERSFELDVAIGVPKKEALELCLKEATEIGIRNIFLVRSDFSQTKIPEASRLEGLLVSALEQSNAPFLPQIIETKWEAINWSSYQEVVLLDSQAKKSQFRSNNTDSSHSRLLIIGPEGGFSERESEIFKSETRIKIVNLPTPILRTPTALAFGAGLMMQSLLK